MWQEEQEWRIQCGVLRSINCLITSNMQLPIAYGHAYEICHTVIQPSVWSMDVILAIGGKDNDGCSSMKTTAIYAFNEQRWYHIGEMAVKAYWVDAVVLSDGDIVVVDGCSLAVMKGEAKVLTELRMQQSETGVDLKEKDCQIQQLQLKTFLHLTMCSMRV
eukprot:Em0094g13a